MNIRHIFSLAFLALIVCGCDTNPKPVTVNGPESNSLLSAANGYIVMDQQFGGILALQLPTLRFSG